MHTRAFVMAIPATAAEQSALAAVGPALSQCIAPGNQIHFTRAVLQGAVAEAAYRQAKLAIPVNK